MGLFFSILLTSILIFFVVIYVWCDIDSILTILLLPYLGFYILAMLIIILGSQH